MSLEYKKLQRAISIANNATGLINDLRGKDTGYETIEMREVIETLQIASMLGKKHLREKGSTEL